MTNKPSNELVASTEPAVPVAASRPIALPRSFYPYIRGIDTRWSDNDMYGHINNVVYYSWFDTVVNSWLIERGVLDLQAPGTIGLVVETRCNYFSSLAFPQRVDVGLRVAHIGTSSVRYELGVFGDAEVAAAQGQFVHVYVDAHSRRPAPLPAAFKTILESLQCV